MTGGARDESTLDGLVVLITGAGSGIGKGLAERFRGDGATVVGCDIGDGVERATSVCDLAVPCDVTDPEQLELVVTEAQERYGHVDVLVANAGIARNGTIGDAAWADIGDVINVNLLGVLHSVRAVLPAMRRQGSGRIIALASRNADQCPAGLVGYNASKAGVIAVTRTLSHELEGTDILVNNLIPGPTGTGMNPRGRRPIDAAYPTARFLATLPAGGPSGRTYFDFADHPVYAGFDDLPPDPASSGVERPDEG